jgi:hypothetical protein
VVYRNLNLWQFLQKDYVRRQLNNENGGELPMLSSIYLTGGSLSPAQYSQSQGTSPGTGYLDWRTFALTSLQNHGLRVVNPLELPWSEVDFLEAIDLVNTGDERVKRALNLIDQCDGLLANLERPSYGTAMEIFYAHRSGKMVTVVGQAPFNPWVLSHSQARFNHIDRALQHIIGQQPHSNPVDFAIQYESLLADRYEQMPGYGEPDYKFIGGELPVLVLAPHATAFWREGEFHEQESFTGSMSVLLNRFTSCHTLHSNYCLAADTTWYLETPTRKAIAEIVKSAQIGMVIMLMGATWQEAPGIQLSHYSKPSTADSGQIYYELLKGKLSQIEPIVPQAADNHIGPLATFLSQTLGLPVMAIRLHKRYRMPKLQGEHFKKTTLAIASFIKEVGHDLETQRKKS